LIINIAGIRYGRLTALKGTRVRHRTVWLCLCDCGNTVMVRKDGLVAGSNKSCGCLNSDNHTTHKMSKTPEYHIYQNMLYRCLDLSCPQYAQYGGRGIRVCDRWQLSFTAFLSDMGLRPSSRHSIERVNNDGDYCPKNCKWALPVEQVRNRRGTVRVPYKGTEVTLASLSVEFGIKYGVLYNRVVLLGWSLDRALKSGVHHHHN